MYICKNIYAKIVSNSGGNYMFKKGNQKVGGRKAGTPNKVTQSARAVIATLLDNNAEKMQVWLDEIYAKDGALAGLFNELCKLS